MLMLRLRLSYHAARSPVRGMDTWVPRYTMYMYYVETEPRQRSGGSRCPANQRIALACLLVQLNLHVGDRSRARGRGTYYVCKQAQASEADDPSPITPRSIASPPDSHTLAPTCSIESPVWAATCSKQAYDEGPGTPHGLETTSCNLHTITKPPSHLLSPLTLPQTPCRPICFGHGRRAGHVRA
jgi:hypothetical protein